MSSLPHQLLGVDLSGPTNTASTAAACFRVEENRLVFVTGGLGYSDEALCELATTQAERGTLVVGLDAPLSYNPGGGDRPQDRALRKRLVEAGLPSGSVMTPTMTRMAYLTLRGMAVARALHHVAPRARIAEVHPGGTMALRQAPIDALRTMKNDAPARRDLVRWLTAQGLTGLPDGDVSDHEVAAYGCALAAWKWAAGEAVWYAPASHPLHPYAVVC